MSDLSNITNATLDKLTAKVGNKVYSLTGCTIRLQVHAPATAEIILAQGESIRQNTRATGATGRLQSSDLNAFTKVVISLYMDGNTSPVILFRGFVSSVSNIAAKNAAGSYAGVVINCTAPPALMTTYNMNNYRYWGSKFDGKGKLSVLSSGAGMQTTLEQLGKGIFSPTFSNKEASIQAQDGFAEFIVKATGVLIEAISNERYKEDSVTSHFETRGRKLLPSSGLAAVGLNVSKVLMSYIQSKIRSANPYATIQAVLGSQMFINLIPMPCGKMDMIPAFPWSKEVIGTIRRRDILSLRDSTAMRAMNENVDAVMVPVLYNALEFRLNDYVIWPETADLPSAGVSKVVNIPQWLSPFANSVAYLPKQTTTTKTNKSSKDTTTDIEKKSGDYRAVALILAKAFFAEVKNSGVTMEVAVPWNRLEFLDALGYLMEIEQPLVGTESARENLFGLLSGAALKIQTTPGGSSATMNLLFSHVRGESLQSSYSLGSNPLYSVQGGPVSKLQEFISKTTRTFTRQIQISLEGGSYDNYLDKAIAAASNKK